MFPSPKELLLIEYIFNENINIKIFLATDGSLMGLGVSRSVPSSPGERSPSDKFSLATCDHVSGSGDVSTSGGQLPVQYNNKVRDTFFIIAFIYSLWKKHSVS